ncbi:TATA box-binding protein-associated factor RNA polymerase I subunit B [Mactra antiquata]
MPECIVCGDNDFEEQDGLYFCGTCNTQSQDVRVFDADDENMDAINKKGRIKEASETQRTQKKEYHGRPWSVYEAYTRILRCQVDTLIQLGAEKRLNDIVFQIWANYLHKLKVAFVEDVTKQTGVKYERRRDLYQSTTDKPKVKKLRTRSAMSAKKASEQLDRDQAKVALMNEEFYEGDNPLSVSGTSTALDLEDTEEKYGKYRKKMMYDSVEKVRMSSTLAVCLLGLMFTNPMITCNDLLRWVKEKRIPYLETKHLFSEDMMFSLKDNMFFSMGNAPTVDQLRHTAGSIAFFLGIDNFPEFPMVEMVNKFIMLLDLPAELHGYIQNLVTNMPVPTRYTPVSSYTKIFDWEHAAMTYIVIFLKMFFGLNDSNEIMLSEVTSSLEEISECSRPLFVWTDWIQHMKNRMLFNKKTKDKKSDTDTISENIQHRINYKLQYSVDGRNGKGILYQKNFRIDTQRIFSKLDQRWQLAKNGSLSRQSTECVDEGISDDDDLHNNDNIISDLLNSSVRTNSQAAGNSGLSSAQSKTLNELTSRGERFRLSTLQHIISPRTYITDLKNRSHDIESQGQADIDDGTESDICSSIISNSIDPKRKRFRRSQQKRHISESIHEETDSFECIVSTDIQKYEKLIDKLVAIKENLWTSLDFDTGGNICLSYDWLLKICVFVSDCDFDGLRNMIKRFEIRYLSEPDDPGLTPQTKRYRRILRTERANIFYKKLNT